MAKNSFKLFSHSLISVLLLFGLIKIIFSSSLKFFNLGLFVLFFMIAVNLLGLLSYRDNEKKLFLFYTLYLAGLIFIWSLSSNFHLVLVLLALFGFLMSLPKKTRYRGKKNSNSLDLSELGDANLDAAIEKDLSHSLIFAADEDKHLDEEKVKVEKAAAKHIPGKYVASTQGNVYHEPKCTWAKRINKDRQLWFADKGKARNQGYKAHTCAQ